MYYVNKNKIFHELGSYLKSFTREKNFPRHISPNLTKKNSQIVDMLIGFQTELCMYHVCPIFYRYHEKITAEKLVTDYNKMSKIFNDIIAKGTEMFGNLLGFEYIICRLYDSYKNTPDERFCARLADVIDIWSCVDRFHPDRKLDIAGFRFDKSGHNIENGEFHRGVFNDVIRMNTYTLHNMISKKSFVITSANDVPEQNDVKVEFKTYYDYTNNKSN